MGPHGSHALSCTPCLGTALGEMPPVAMDAQGSHGLTEIFFGELVWAGHPIETGVVSHFGDGVGSSQLDVGATCDAQGSCPCTGLQSQTVVENLTSVTFDALACNFTPDGPSWASS